MIITELMGGMGNQLFQYALGRKLSLQHGVPLLLDITSFTNRGPAQGTKREYTLGAFCISPTLIDTQLRKLLWVALHRPASVVEKKDIRFDEAVLSVTKNSYLHGFWLSEKYFKDIRNTLLKDLQLKNPLGQTAQEVLTLIEETESVAIHVRRGDNITNPKSAAFHGSPSQKDYENRMTFFAQKLANPHYFIFSDDISWCREHISSDHPITYVTGNTAYPHEDLHLMRNCKHIAMSNSTLSWWGAWLNENPNKIVLKPPFFTLGKFDTVNLYPSEWLSL